MSTTKIEWTDRTWNPVRGCSRVSEGCRNCYAERQAARFSRMGQPYHGFAAVVAPRDRLDAVGGRRRGWTGRVELITDSQYVAKGLSDWMPKWKAAGWRRGKRGEVKNIELWQRLDELTSKHVLKCTHVFGHAGHPENEECDRLAVQAYQQWL